MIQSNTFHEALFYHTNSNNNTATLPAQPPSSFNLYGAALILDGLAEQKGPIVPGRDFLSAMYRRGIPFETSSEILHTLRELGTLATNQQLDVALRPEMLAGLEPAVKPDSDAQVKAANKGLPVVDSEYTRPLAAVQSDMAAVLNWPAEGALHQAQAA